MFQRRCSSNFNSKCPSACDESISSSAWPALCTAAKKHSQTGLEALSAPASERPTRQLGAVLHPWISIVRVRRPRALARSNGLRFSVSPDNQGWHFTVVAALMGGSKSCVSPATRHCQGAHQSCLTLTSPPRRLLATRREREEFVRFD